MTGRAIASKPSFIMTTSALVLRRAHFFAVCSLSIRAFVARPNS